MERVKKVLCVGKICLDIVIECNSYPEEDSDQRCLSHIWQLGGNASNNATVLSLFNIPSEVLGSLSHGLGGQFLQRQFLLYNISFDHCHIYIEYDSPTSVVLINSQNGSRTIIHSNKNLPELTFQDFEVLNLSDYSWVHFEVRPNTEEIKKMIDHVRKWNSQEVGEPIKISVEMEKPKLELMDFINLGDFVFISKDFAIACGYTDMIAAVQFLSHQLRPGAVIICAWGELGACAKSQERAISVSKAYSPLTVVNTLGAGDTFVAATIMGLMQGKSIDGAIELGCKVAGIKCGTCEMSKLAELFAILS